MARGPRLALLGKQGAGKGTQCARLSRHYSIPHVSSGDMFRAELKSGSEVGERLAKFIKAGELVPDDVVIDIIDRRLAIDHTRDNGFILDGFPRTANQAEELFRLLAPGGLDMAIDLHVPTDVVLRRLSARRVCEDCGANFSTDRPPKVNWTCDACGGDVVQRDDDTEEAICKRLELYEQETAPLTAWYLSKDKLVTVDGLGTPDAVGERLTRAIDQRLERHR